MFCTNCGAKFEGRFCPNCGTPVAEPNETQEVDESSTALEGETEELMVYDGTQELFDAAGIQINLQQIYTVYKNEAGVRKYLDKYTEYEPEEINSIVSYMLSHLTPDEINMIKRGALQLKIESKVDSFRKAQSEENKKNGIVCPNCHGTNVQVSLEQAGFKNKKKKNSIVRGMARGTMILSTGGLWALTPKADGKEKSKAILKTFAVCQDCGNSWEIKK